MIRTGVVYEGLQQGGQFGRGPGGRGERILSGVVELALLNQTVGPIEEQGTLAFQWEVCGLDENHDTYGLAHPLK